MNTKTHLIISTRHIIIKRRRLNVKKRYIDNTGHQNSRFIRTSTSKLDIQSMQQDETSIHDTYSHKTNNSISTQVTGSTKHKASTQGTSTTQYQRKSQKEHHHCFQRQHQYHPHSTFHNTQHLQNLEEDKAWVHVKINHQYLHEMMDSAVADVSDEPNERRKEQ